MIHPVYNSDLESSSIFITPHPHVALGRKGRKRQAFTKVVVPISREIAEICSLEMSYHLPGNILLI